MNLQPFMIVPIACIIAIGNATTLKLGQKRGYEAAAKECHLLVKLVRLQLDQELEAFFKTNRADSTNHGIWFRVPFQTSTTNFATIIKVTYVNGDEFTWFDRSDR